MNIWFIGASLLSILTLAACKPELTAQSPLASPLLSPIEAVPTDTPIPVPTQTSTPRPANIVVHIIQPGDTILGLALQYHVPVEQIYQLNSLQPDSVLRIGQELIIGDQSIGVATSTQQPTLTATPLPTIVPPISVASSSNQPALAQDLLYVRDGYLFRWNHVTGQQEVLAGPDMNGQSLSDRLKTLPKVSF